MIFEGTDLVPQFYDLLVQSVYFILQAVDVLPVLLVFCLESFVVPFKSVDFPLGIEFLGGVGFEFPLEGVNFLSVLFDKFS